MGLFERLKEGLSKTSASIANGLDAVFGDYSQVDEDFFEELEEVLIMADVGMKATGEILDRMRERIYAEHLKKPEDVRRVLAETVAEQLKPGEDAYAFTHERSVVLVIGVNGVGKTTTIGKLAMKYRNAGRKVILAAADTFRAAAIEQLEVWAERAGAELVSKPEGSDPAAVIYDAVQAFEKQKGDILICDTAGRLHNKKNLMEELGKINRILAKSLPEVRKEVLLVLDATTGQNAVSQAREFMAVCEPTGIILTKMDGSAKGGIVIAISSEFEIPVKYIGVGEHAEDLQEFDPNAFMRALFQ